MEESGARGRTMGKAPGKRFRSTAWRRSWLPVMVLAIALLLIGKPASAEITMSFTQPAIATGFYHTVALKSDGTVMAWGYDYYGQTTVPANLAGVTAVAAGAYHSVALKNDGTVVAWGYNLYDQSKVPAFLSSVTAIAAGAYHTVALKSDGTVVAWGRNQNGESAVPAGLSGVIAISAAGYHTLVLKSDGTVVGWGYNVNGESTVPADITGVAAIAAGGYHSVALKTDGTIVTWGRNVEGQCTVPAGLTGVVAIAAGTNHTTALKSDGTVMVWGDDTYGETSVPADLTGVTALVAGKEHTVALKSDGTAVAWGRNTYGECTVPAGLNLITRYRVMANTPAIAAGDSHTVALKSDGTVVAWGRNQYGESTVPEGLSGITAVASGAYHTVALKSDGTVAAWGNNDQGQITVPAGLINVAYVAAGGSHTVALKSDGTAVAWGDNTYGESAVPVGLSGVTAIAAGAYHTAALKSDGTVVAWGDNTYGESAVPEALAGVIAISAGGFHTVALKSDGTMVAWGDNTYGESAVPAGLSRVTVMAAGAYHTVALKSDGTVAAWGSNDQGQATVPAGLNLGSGRISCIPTSVGYNSSSACMIMPGIGYQVLDVQAGPTAGVMSSVGAGTSYTIGNITADMSIAATFGAHPASDTTPPITTASPIAGSYSVAQSITLSCDDGSGSGCNTTYYCLGPGCTPATLYRGAFTIANSTDLRFASTDNAGNAETIRTQTFTITMVNPTLSATAGPNGSISPSGNLTILPGGNGAFTITANAGYRVADVLIDGVSAGALTSYTFINVQTTHTISAAFTLDVYTVAAAADVNGSITPSGTTTVNKGDSLTYTITPVAGYEVQGVIVDGVTKGAITSYPFANIAANHTINAYFKVKTYTITPSAGTGGSISPLGTSTFNIYTSQTYAITPTAGYHILDVLVDGASIGAVTTYAFTNITDNHTISATFEANPSYTITASAGANGALSPAGNVSVLGGTNRTITVTPDAGYRVADVLADGVSVGALASYTFSNVQTDHTISAAFTLDVYTVAAASDVNGSITPSGTTTVNKGDSLTYTITPVAGYEVQGVIVDGVTKGAITSYPFANIAANHTINAYFKVKTYTITPSAGTGGSISPLGITTVNIGTSQTYTITPTAGYHIMDVLIDGVSVGAVATYAFTNVTSNHTIAAIFEANPSYTITASVGANGALSPLGNVSVLGGTNRTFTVTPNAGYRVVDVTIDGASAGPLKAYTFVNIADNHSISATFALKLYYDITASVGPDGSISPAGTASVPEFTNQTYAITPNAGYRVADVLVDGASVGAPTSYTFYNVQAPHTISATFTLDVYTVTAAADANGSITPSGVTTVNKGNSQTYTIAPNQGYQVLSVIVDGANKGAITSYTFTNITANHTINSYFKVITYTITASVAAGGSISPLGITTVNIDASQTYTITPTGGYHIVDVQVDGVSVGAVATYTFTNVTGNHTIAATFAANQLYTVTASAGANGTISPGTVTVLGGASQKFTIAAATGYRVADVLVDGVSVGARTSYTFSNVQSDHAISASFTRDVYTITSAADVNGSITPSGTLTVNKGVSQTYTITPAAGRQVRSVIVDGANRGAITSFTFTNITANHTINAYFK